MRQLYLLVTFWFLVSFHIHGYTTPSLTTWNDPVLLNKLASGKIIRTEPMQDVLKRQHKKADFNSAVQLLTLDNGLKAVFKSTSNPNETYAEIMAYRLSKFLGFPHVPPTIMRKIDGKLGSLQLYVDSPTDLTDPDMYEKIIDKISDDAFSHLHLFYFLIGHWDGSPKNLVHLDDKQKDYLISIDHAKSCTTQYMRFGEFPFVLIGTGAQFKGITGPQFPYNAARTTTLKELKQRYAPYLISSFVKNHTHPDEHIDYIIYDGTLWHHSTLINTHNIINPCTRFCSPATLANIKRLNENVLKELSADFPKGHYMNVCHIKTILDRRGQIVEMFKKGG